MLVWRNKLGDTIDFYSGLTYSPSDVVKDNGVFVLRSSNVREGEIVDEDNVYVRAGAVNSDNVNIGDINDFQSDESDANCRNSKRRRTGVHTEATNGSNAE